MQLHMLNWQCFRCLNIAQPGLRHEILKKKKPSTGNMNYFSQERELNLTTCSTWHCISQRASDSFLQTFHCCTQKPPWSFADWGLTFELDAQRAIHHATECKLRYWELSSRPPSVHVRAEEKLLRAIWLWEGVCKLISESLNSGWLFYLSAAAVAAL